MASDKYALTLRAESEQDKAFLETLHRSTRDDLLQSGLPEALLNNLLLMQFNAQQQGYRTQFPDANYVIIEKDGAPIGHQITAADATTIRLVYLALLPQERNRGHGRRLIEALQVEAANTDKTLRLSVARHNLHAQHVYLACGFQISHEDGANLEMNWQAREKR